MATSANKADQRLTIIAFAVLALFFAFGLFDHSLWSSNDTRGAAMISEMYRTGTWVTPVFNGQPNLEKPPLNHWTSLVFCHIFGGVNEGLVRLPAALFGLGAVLIAFFWARAVGHKWAGISAAFMCGTSLLYLEYSKIVLTDASLTFMVMLSLFLFWNAYTAETRIKLRYAVFLVVAALAFYAKGLIGPGLIWASVCVYLLLQKKWKLLILLMAIFAGVFIVILGPWVLALVRTGGTKFLYEVFWTNQFGRFLTFTDSNLPLDPYFVHKEPIYYYLLELPVRLLPWTLLVIGALFFWFKKDCPLDMSLAGFLRVALVMMLVVLHLSSSKAACYAMPLFPILFLMTALWLEHAAGHWSTHVDRWVIGVSFILIGLVVVLLPLGYIVSYLFGLWFVRAPGLWIGLACFVLALLTFGVALYAARRLWKTFIGGQRREAALLTPMVVAFLVTLGGFCFLPAMDYQRTYEPFARMLGVEKDGGRRIAILGDNERNCGAFMFYLDSKLETIAVTNRRKYVNFLYGSPGRAGIIVTVDDLSDVINDLPGNRKFTIQKSKYNGRKCADFRLLINNR